MAHQVGNGMAFSRARRALNQHTAPLIDGLYNTFLFPIGREWEKYLLRF